MDNIIEFHMLELILWAVGISALNFAAGMLFIVCLSFREQRRTEAIIKLPKTKPISSNIDHCQKCGANRRDSDGRWIIRCAHCNDYQPF